jgi:predicted Ser/Thr protein kinase
VETLTALVAGFVGRLHGLTTDAVCPGGWPWAVSLLGVGVGLLPVAGAVAVALWRRRIGSRYGFGRSLLLVGTGLLAAGLAPLLVFTATGQVFAAAAAGQRVTGLTRPELRSMDTAVCVVGPQSSYLGEGTVAEAFAAGDPLRTGLAVLALFGMPLVAALLTAASARLAFRRGPRWPVRAFWLPLLAVAVLTAEVPAGSAAHLWLGAAAGASAGVPLLLLVGPPRWAAVHAASAPRRPSGRPRPTGREVRSRPAVPAASTATGDRRRGWAERLAERFAARTPEPLVSTRSDAFPAVRDRVGAAAGSARPAATLVAPPLPPRASRRRDTLPRSGPVTPPVAHRSLSVTDARFRLVRRLGSGGFGRVWLAHDAQRGHIVALKAAHVRDAETEERIRREARALAAVRHPHCVQIHDLVPADSDPGLAELDGMVIVMEYVRGSSLSELVRAHGTLDDVAAARVWASIADALDAAHERGVLHRDVKPGNIVVDADGQAHLIDFGIARRTGEATLTLAGSVLGTPDFLAPEVARGGRATPRSDAWQLAATIGYALTASPPHGEHADAMAGLRAAALGAPPTHLPRKSAHVTLLRAALDPDPARRPTLRAVHSALEAWLHPAGERSDGAMAAGSTGR